MFYGLQVERDLRLYGAGLRPGPASGMGHLFCLYVLNLYFFKFEIRSYLHYVIII